MFNTSDELSIQGVFGTFVNVKGAKKASIHLHTYTSLRTSAHLDVYVTMSSVPLHDQTNTTVQNPSIHKNSKHLRHGCAAASSIIAIGFLGALTFILRAQLVRIANALESLDSNLCSAMYLLDPNIDCSS